jgi:hypothetical protein
MHNSLYYIPSTVYKWVLKALTDYLFTKEIFGKFTILNCKSCHVIEMRHHISQGEDTNWANKKTNGSKFVFFVQV